MEAGRWPHTPASPLSAALLPARAQIPWDFHDLVAAVAPRPCLLAAPLHDSNFEWRSVDKV